jgi:hypothetical protein
MILTKLADIRSFAKVHEFYIRRSYDERQSLVSELGTRQEPLSRRRKGNVSKQNLINRAIKILACV